MATIGVAAATGAGGFLAAATPGQIALATFAANYVDQKWIFPFLFGRDNRSGPRLGDLVVQGAEEGEPQYQCIGPECPLPGQLFWAGQLVTEDVEEQLGKHGSLTTYRYYRNVGLHLCHNPIRGVDRIKADGKLIYTDQPDILIASHLLDVELRVEIVHGGQINFLKITQQVLGPDLTAIHEGRDVVLDGFTPAANNGTFRVTNTGTTSAGFSFIKVRDPSDPAYPFANGTAGTVGAPATIFQNLPRWTPGQADQFNLKRGSFTQPPPGVIEEIEGEGTVPSFTNQSLMMIRRLALSNFNNRVPGFMFLVRERDECSVAEAIDQLCAWAGLDESQYDTSELGYQEFRGYPLRGLQTTVERLGPILLAYDIIASDEGTKIVFRDRANANERAVVYGDLGAHTIGSRAPQAITVRDRSDVQSPRRVKVRYTDPASDYQSGSQGERRRGLAHGETLNVEFPLTLTGEEAKKIARRILWTSEANRQELSISLPPSYLGVVPGHVLTFSENGRNWRMLVEKVDRGADFSLRIQGLAENATTLNLPSTGVEPGGATTGSIGYFPPDAWTVIFDWAPLRNTDNSVPGIYYGAAATGQTAEWIGGTLMYKRLDNQGNPLSGPYEPLVGITSETVCGVTDGTLGDADPAYLDLVNTLDVEMSHGELESVSDDEFYAGANIAIVGEEVVAFRDAELIGPFTYRLSRFIRGLRDTQGFTGDHGANEQFVIVTGALRFHAPGFTFRNDFRYRAVPTGGDVSEYVPRQIDDEFQAGNARTFTPGNFSGVFDSSNDLILTWQRRSRWVGDTLNSGLAPLLEPTEGYILEFFQGAATTGTPKFTAGTLVNPITTKDANGFPTYTFTSSAQTTAGYVSTNTIQCRVQQISPYYDDRYNAQIARYRRQAVFSIVKP